MPKGEKTEVFIMGLITAAVSSVSGTLADSWKDVIEPDDMTDSTLLVRGVMLYFLVLDDDISEYSKNKQ